ncbi:MAG: copper amine oxidase N-terminal domain-containing protein [Syntrophomonadaceae bacterium]|nr:copper amine oxidase N-terminal domain-containing protein [Syntrophomonadaceae bacterium]
MITKVKSNLIALMLVFAVAFIVSGLCFPTTAAAAAKVEVKTLNATAVDDESATLNGEITDDNGLDVEAFGFYYGTSKTTVAKGDDGSAKAKEADGDEDDFYLDLEDLSSGKTYYFMAYAEDENGKFTYGSVKSFATDDSSSDVEVATNSASGIGSDYATLNGEIADDNGLYIEEYGFYYGTVKSEVADGEDGDAEVDEADGDEDDFYLELTDLDSNKTYYYMAYAIDEDDDIAYGSVKSFTTKKPAAVVTNPSVFTFGSTNYILRGSPQAMDVAPYAKDGRTYLPVRYVAYAMGLTDADIVWIQNTNTVVLTKGSTRVVLMLGSRILYTNGVPTSMDVAAEARNGRTCLPIAWIAAAFGHTATWDQAAGTVTISGSGINTAEIEVTTNSASDISNDSATLNGAIADANGLDIEEYGFYYGTNKSEVADGEEGYSDVQEADGDEDDFYLDLDDLDADETYYFMAYAEDENGNVTYGSVKSFTTDDSGDVAVSTLSATSIGIDSATLNGKVTDDGNLDIEEYGFYYGTDRNDVADGEEGYSDVQEADGDEDDFYLDLDDLDEDETYYFMAYAIDENDDISYGSIRSFKTR